MSAVPAAAPDLAPDFVDARRFLAALAPDDTRFLFLTFDDKKKDKTLTAVVHSTFDEAAEQLADLNARGAGVFVTINRTKGKRREKEDVTGIRAAYADFDRVPLEHINRLPLTPHITVETSPGKWHVYYRTLGVPVDRFEAIQTALIECFESDPQVKGPERVMRLPGFWHQKGKPFLTKIVDVKDGRPYGLSDFSKAPNASDAGSTADNVVAMPQPEEREKAVAMAQEKARRTHDTTAGRRSAMTQLAFDLKAAGFNRPTASIAARVFAKECRPTDSEGQPGAFPEKDALDLVANAYKPGKVVNPRDGAGGQKQKKRHLNNHAGTMDVLRNDPKLREIIKYDEMVREVVIVTPIPGGRFVEGGTKIRTDQDISVLQEYLQRNGRPELGYDTLWKAVEQRARENNFHPVRDYLNTLAWDGVERLPSWMSLYLGADDTEYVRTIGRMFMIALVARVFAPGCKMDHMVVLEGEQGAAKSTACRILGGDWFSDSLPAIDSGKEVSVHLKRCWLVEISELSAMNKADTEDLKRFVARQEEEYRPPYGRALVKEPRQCVFVGTTNKSEYLRDETGGRRFWPVKVADRVDTDGLIAMRGQLFAEAVARYKRGEPWWPDRDLDAAIFKPEQEARFEADAWEEQIKTRLSESRTVKVTIADVLDYIGLPPDRQHSGHQRRAVAVMERIGWKRAEKRGTGGVRWWEPGSRWVPVEVEVKTVKPGESF